MWRILQQETPDDFIIATGLTSTLEQFVEAAYGCIGENWLNHVTIDEQLFRPSDIIHSRMDPTKASVDLGWKAKYTMPDVVRLMFEEEIRRIEAED